MGDLQLPSNVTIPVIPPPSVKSSVLTGSGESSEVGESSEATSLYRIIDNVLSVTDDILGYVEPVTSNIASALEYGSSLALFGGLTMFSPTSRSRIGSISAAVSNTRSAISAVNKANTVKKYVDMLSNPEFYKNMTRYFGGYNDIVTYGMKSALGVNLTDVERKQFRSDVSEIVKRAFTSYADESQPFTTALAKNLPSAPFIRDVGKVFTDASERVSSYAARRAKAGTPVPFYAEAVRQGIRVKDRFIKERRRVSRYIRLFQPLLN